MKTYTIPILIVLASLLFACGEAASEATPAADSTSTLPEHYWLSSLPEGARDVGAVRADAEDGATVTVRGRIGGSVKPFVEGLAAFTLVDPALASCVGDGMGCETPWDYCCVDPQALLEGSVTVELRDGDRLRTGTLRGTHGLEHLEEVVVQGTAERDAQGNVTIVASGIRVVG